MSAGNVVEEMLSRLRVCKVDGDSLDAASGLFAGQQLRLGVEDLRSIGFDPYERAGKLQTVGAGIQSGCEIEDGVRLDALDAVEDQLVEDGRSHGENPREPTRPWMGARQGGHPFSDPLPALASEPAGERIAEPSVGTLGFQRTVKGHPTCRIRDVLNERRGGGCGTLSAHSVAPASVQQYRRMSLGGPTFPASTSRAVRGRARRPWLRRR